MEEKADIQIVVDPKVKADRFFIHVARQFPDEATADAHFAHMKDVTAIEGCRMIAIQANMSGKWVVVLFMEPSFGKEEDRKRAVAELGKAGLPIQLAPADARKLGAEIIEAGL